MSLGDSAQLWTDWRKLGGISFFSPQFGFVCDSVLNYEVSIISDNRKCSIWVDLILDRLFLHSVKLST